MDTAPDQPRDFGPRPELGWMPVDQLSVDDRYQRTMDSKGSQAAIKKIMENFRWSCFGAALVTEADQGWRIIDGQHRVEAARRLGLKTVPCIVAHQTSLSEQAAIFVSTNQVRVQVNPYALFHARLLAGDPLAIEVQRLCDQAALTIPKYPIQKTRLLPGQTMALAALETIVRNGGAGPSGVIAAGQAYRQRKGACTATIIRAAALAALEKPQAVEAIQAFFTRHDPDSLNASYSGAVGVMALVRRIVESVTSAAKGPALPPSGFIAAPTKAQLMGGR